MFAGRECFGLPGQCNRTIAASFIRGTAQSIPFNAETVVQWDTIISDPAKGFDPNTFTYKISDPGLYFIYAQGTFVANSTGLRYVNVYVNSSSIAFGREDNPSGSNTCQFSTCIVYPLNVGDVIKVVYFQNSGGSLSTSSNAGDNLFGLFRIPEIR